MARQTGETRYWGRAQAVLMPWWDDPNAPVDLVVLQATVQQGRHEFEAARHLLVAALAREPRHAQGWLTLASLNRLSARYADSLKACEAVATSGQALYAAACKLETQSMLGQHDLAINGFEQSNRQVTDSGQASWLWSLMAEALERAGRDEAAARAFQRSLALSPDLYTTIAYSDLLLRTKRSESALNVLNGASETDAVLLRRATAWKQLGQFQWKEARESLRVRTAELVRRGDDPLLHARELALMALWLDDNPAEALRLARINLQLQKEPFDWWVAVQSANSAKTGAALKELRTMIQSVGLRDQRLDAALQLSAKTPAATSMATRVRR